MKDFVLQYFTLLNMYFYLSKGSDYLLHHCCAAPQNGWISPLRQAGPLRKTSAQASWNPSLPLCSRTHVFSGLVCRGTPRGNHLHSTPTCWPPWTLTVLIPRCYLGRGERMSTKLTRRRSIRRGETSRSAKINCDDTFVWESSVFINLLTSNTAWVLRRQWRKSGHCRHLWHWMQSNVNFPNTSWPFLAYKSAVSSAACQKPFESHLKLST